MKTDATRLETDVLNEKVRNFLKTLVLYYQNYNHYIDGECLENFIKIKSIIEFSLDGTPDVPNDDQIQLLSELKKIDLQDDLPDDFEFNLLGYSARNSN